MHVVIDAGDLIAMLILLVTLLLFLALWLLGKLADWSEAHWQKIAMGRRDEHDSDANDTGTPEVGKDDFTA